MKHKTVARIAIVMVVVFGVIVVAYPLMFNPEKEAVPVETPITEPAVTPGAPIINQ